MGWDDYRAIEPLGPPGPIGPERRERIELVSPHLRVTGDISLLRFSRLSDLINHSRGYVKLTGAQLLRRNGEPTRVIVPELMVNKDEITFVGQQLGDVSTAETGLVGGLDRPLMERVPRELVIFTEGHTLRGTIYLFSETDIATFVDSPDPRFVPMIGVTARSLADRRVISHFGLVLVNRTHISAASMVEMAGGADETGVPVD
ncbi:MAG: hypothetical protein ABSA21_01410 [Candidatus Limnocylindrales bacterium]|jgi:hypothetical protein